MVVLCPVGVQGHIQGENIVFILLLLDGSHVCCTCYSSGGRTYCTSGPHICIGIYSFIVLSPGEVFTLFGDNVASFIRGGSALPRERP